MRIGIVNDMPIAVEAIRRAVLARPEHSVAWVATDGGQAISRCRDDLPDVVLMDMVMPGMDGVEATRRIMRDTPCPIVVVTATVEGNSQRVYEALGHGALDAVRTPEFGLRGEIEGWQPLLRKLAHVAMLAHREPAETVDEPSPPPAPILRRPGIVAIGASTGGPQALLQVLRGFPRPCPWPIVVVQHLGAEFVPGLAAWLEQSTGISVRLVAGLEPLRDGTLYLAQREAHLVCETPTTVTVSDEPTDSLHRPSVDVLFGSLRVHDAAGVAVLLTGMGRDGADGLLGLRRAGWWTIAQDRATSVVWGMPGEAVRIGAAIETLGLDAIGPAVTAAMSRAPAGVAQRGVR
jgi:two-component system response regulator WspF